MNDQPTKTRPEDQPLPAGGQECVQDALIRLIDERKQLGIQRYGSPLMTHNGRDAGRDMVEEAVDLAVYSMQVAMELRDLRAAVERVRAIKRAPTRSDVNALANAQDNGWDAALYEVQRALEGVAARQAATNSRQLAYDAVYAYIRALGDEMPSSTINRNAMIWHAVNDALEAVEIPAVTSPVEDTCRPLEVDGETVRVRGSGELSEDGEAALRDVMRAARRRLINEQRAAMAKYPYEDGDTTVLGPEIFAAPDGKVISWKGENFVPQLRLRLAHEARRGKEGLLDGIRRALCDAGLMEDDDPYGHADLEGVIRQALRPSCPDPIECGHEAALGDAEAKLGRVREIATTWVQSGEPGPTQTAGRCLLHALGEAPAPAAVEQP